jgi:hypothetical protein
MEQSRVGGHVVLVFHPTLLAVPNILRCANAITGPKMTVLNVGRFAVAMPRNATKVFVAVTFRNATNEKAGPSGNRALPVGPASFRAHAVEGRAGKPAKKYG